MQCRLVALALALLPSCVAMADLQPGTAGGGASAGGVSATAGGTAGGASGGTSGGASSTAGGAAPGCTRGRPLDQSLTVTQVAFDGGAVSDPVHYARGAVAFHDGTSVRVLPVGGGPALRVSGDGVLGFAAGPSEWGLLVRRAPDQLWVVRVSEAGAVLRETALIAGGDHAVVGTEWFGEFAQTGRLVRIEGGYAAYSAVHRRWPDNIGHQGDQLRRVMDDGSVDVDWAWGCSHSGAQRLLFTAAGLASVCQSDCYPEKAIMFRHRTAVISQEPSGNCAGGYGGELGGLAAADGGFWFDYSSREGRASWDVALVRLSQSGAVLSRTWIAQGAGDERQPQLAAFDGTLVAGWAAGAQLFAQRVGEAPAALAGVRYSGDSDWVATPEGDVVWAFAGNGSVQLARLRACVP